MTSLSDPKITTPDPLSVARDVAAARSVDAQTKDEDASRQNQSEIQTVTFGILKVDVPAIFLSSRSWIKEDNDDHGESFDTPNDSDVTKYKYDHGRRYHAHQDEKYALPNDEKEIRRLDLQHRIWKLSLSDRLHLAPLPTSIHTALDLGCGTGTWAIEFATLHPDCRVVGADLSTIQPTLVPPNVEFVVDDFTKPWAYPYRFDYIHGRNITVAISDWAKMVEECWRNLESGGWVEFQEFYLPYLCDDDTLARGPAFRKWGETLAEACEKAGTRLDSVLRIGTILEERGFVNVARAHTQWPLGSWAKGEREKLMGRWIVENVINGLKATSLRLFTKILGWSEEDVRTLCRDAAEEIRTKTMHAYLPVDIFWAQKPPNAA